MVFLNFDRINSLLFESWLRVGGGYVNVVNVAQLGLTLPYNINEKLKLLFLY